MITQAEGVAEDVVNQRASRVINLPIALFGDLFVPRVRGRLLSTGFHGWLATRELEVVVKAANALGESHVYLKFLEWDGPKANGWRIQLDSFAEAYGSLLAGFPLDHLLVSEHGAWVVASFHEGFGFAGGSNEFVTLLLEGLGGSKEEHLREVIRIQHEFGVLNDSGLLALLRSFTDEATAKRAIAAT